LSVGHKKGVMCQQEVQNMRCSAVVQFDAVIHVKDSPYELV
jgi:hypothetical protein